MDHKFDELTKQMAQSVTRRGALKKFGIGLAGMALACFGLADPAEGKGGLCSCVTNADCGGGKICSPSGICVPGWCNTLADPCCCSGCKPHVPNCDPYWAACKYTCAHFLNCP